MVSRGMGSRASGFLGAILGTLLAGAAVPEAARAGPERGERVGSPMVVPPARLAVAADDP